MSQIKYKVINRDLIIFIKKRKILIDAIIKIYCINDKTS